MESRWLTAIVGEFFSKKMHTEARGGAARPLDRTRGRDAKSTHKTDILLSPFRGALHAEGLQPRSRCALLAVCQSPYRQKPRENTFPPRNFWVQHVNCKLAQSKKIEKGLL